MTFVILFTIKKPVFVKKCGEARHFAVFPCFRRVENGRNGSVVLEKFEIGRTFGSGSSDKYDFLSFYTSVAVDTKSTAQMSGAFRILCCAVVKQRRKPVGFLPCFSYLLKWLYQKNATLTDSVFRFYLLTRL